MQLNKRKIKRNFRQIILQASPDELLAGKDWYENACEWCHGILETYYIDMEIIVGVLSALSPSVEWGLNKKQAEKLIYGYLILSDVSGVAITTYKRQLRKAIAILDLYKTNYIEADIRDILGRRAYKTKAFYHNIFNPYDELFVTVDHHVWNAAGLVSKKGGINKGEYNLISDCIKELSDEHVLVQYLLPCQLQAIIWLAYKRTSKDLPI